MALPSISFENIIEFDIALLKELEALEMFNDKARMQLNEFCNSIKFTENSRIIIEKLLFAPYSYIIETKDVKFIQLKRYKTAAEDDIYERKYLLDELEIAYRIDFIGHLIMTLSKKYCFLNNSDSQNIESIDFTETSNAFYESFCNTMGLSETLKSQNIYFKAKPKRKKPISQSDQKNWSYDNNLIPMTTVNYKKYIRDNQIPEALLPLCSFWVYYNNLPEDAVFNSKNIEQHQTPQIYIDKKTIEQNKIYIDFEKMLIKQTACPHAINRYLFNQYTPIYDILLCQTYIKGDSDLKTKLENSISETKKEIAGWGLTTYRREEKQMRAIIPLIANAFSIIHLELTHFKYAIINAYLPKEEAIYNKDAENYLAALNTALLRPIEEILKEVNLKKDFIWLQELIAQYEHIVKENGTILDNCNFISNRKT